MSALKGTFTFADLFKGFSKRHGRYVLDGEFKEGNGKATGTAITKIGGAQPSDYERHLSATGPGIGIIPLLDDNKSVLFGAIDIDDYKVDIAKVEKDCENLPVVLSRSKSGGVHIWLFCAEQIPAALVRKKLGEWAAALGHGGCEIFPKQTKRTGENDAGNWINLPYHGDTRLGFIGGHDVDLETFVRVANERAVSEKDLKSFEIAASDYSDGPPCLQHLFNVGIPEGGRNIALFNLGIYFRLVSKDTWEDELVQANVAMDNPIPNAELQTMISSLRKKEYAYQCQQSPLKPHCDRRTCVMRKHGVSDKNAELPVELNNLVKLDTNPPIFYLTVGADGIDTRIRIDSIRELKSLDLFQDIILARVHKMIPAMPTKKWHAIIQELFDEIQVLEAPEDASDEGQLTDHLREFLTETLTDQDRDQLLKGNSWKDEHDVIYFRASDFISYLRKRGVRPVARLVWSVLKDSVDAKKGRWNVKGVSLQWWSVPEKKVGLQDAAFAPLVVTDALGGPQEQPQ